MKNVLLVLVVSCLLILACKSTPTGKELLPQLMQTDSIELIYFRAGDVDSTYVLLPLNDEEFIKEIMDDVSKEVEEQKKCATDGRIKCYGKGVMINTLAFSYDTKDCVQFICTDRDKKYRFKMSDDVREKLAKFKSFAREPE